MCEPVTVGLILGSAALGARAQYQEGMAKSAEMEAQARFNEMQAGDARQRGALQGGLSRIETSQTIAQGTVDMAAVGVDVSGGTPVDVREQSRIAGEYKAALVENDAMRQAWGYEANAKTLRASARNARESARMGAVTSLIGGGAKAFFTGNKLGG